jgi:hypothetical protein
MSKEAKARIKINKLLEAAGWRSDQITEKNAFFPSLLRFRRLSLWCEF